MPQKAKSISDLNFFANAFINPATETARMIMTCSLFPICCTFDVIPIKHQRQTYYFDGVVFENSKQNRGGFVKRQLITLIQCV